MICLMKDELDEKMMTEFGELTAKVYSYWKNNDEVKKRKVTKKFVIKNKIIFVDYKN